MIQLPDNLPPMKMLKDTFKTKKVSRGMYELHYIREDGITQLIGSAGQLEELKTYAVTYAIRQDPECTQFRITHHKPGRVRDKVEIIKIKG